MSSAVTFDPLQAKVCVDTRAGANSPWAPLWVPPQLPEDGRWMALPACFAAMLIAGDGHAQEMIELPGEDRPLVLELADVYRIGSASAVADWEVLSNVPAAGFDEAGNLYLLDSPIRVVVVGPGGNFLGQIGRPGDGPGEFRNPGQVDVWPSGRIVVSDMGHFAFQVFGPGGVFEHTQDHTHRSVVG